MTDRLLAVLRHAKSAWPGGVPDHDRPLNARGVRDAAAAGEWLGGPGRPGFDRVVVSPARRTRQTWELVDAALGHAGPVTVDPRVYGADVEGLLDVLRELPAAAHSVLLVAHSPGCPDLVETLAAYEHDAAAWEQVRAKYPTAGVALLTVRGLWSDVGPGAARLDGFAVPRG